MPRGVAAINRLWNELQAQRAEEALRAQQEADALPVRWDDFNALPPGYEPDPQAAPTASYGLLDLIPTKWGDPPESFRRWPATPSPTPPMAHGLLDLLPARWGGQPGEFSYAPRPEPWTASLGMMPPPLPSFEALEPMRFGPLVPTAGGGPPAAIAGWPTGALPGVSPQPVQWPDPSMSLLPAMPPALPLGQSGAYSKPSVQDQSNRARSLDWPEDGAFGPSETSLPPSNRDSDQWTGPEILSDITPDNFWIPGAQYAAGHHHVPQALYKSLPLRPETREVFEKATTGHLPILGWHNYNDDHRAYSKAADELVNRFMQERNIRAEQMTPDHARAVLRAVAASDDPRIQHYREMFARMRMLYRTLRRLRSGD